MSSKYQPRLALKEHMLEGHRVTILEAFLLFGVQAFNRSLTEFKREGFLVKSEKKSTLYTNKEKFDDLLNNNKSLVKLSHKLGLDPEY